MLPLKTRIFYHERQNHRTYILFFQSKAHAADNTERRQSSELLSVCTTAEPRIFSLGIFASDTTTKPSNTDTDSSPPLVPGLGLCTPEAADRPETVSCF